MKKKIRIALLSLVVSFAIFIIIINLFKGPTLTVTNCNEKVFTGSKVCCNADGYYYIGNKGSIVHIDNEGKSNILYDEKENFEYIACNSKYIYAAYEQILVQFSLNGDIIRRIDTFSDKKSYTDITGLYADDNGLLCADLSCYLILNPDTLEDLRLIDYMDNPQKTSFGDINIYSDENRSFVSAIVKMTGDMTHALGTGFFENDKIVNIILSDIVGYTDSACVRYGYTPVTLTDAYDESDRIIDGKIDIRHIYTKDDHLVSFGSYYSDSKRSALMMFCFPKYKYTLEFGLYDEYPLMFHEYDNISIVDLSNKKIQEYRTNLGEKVIYLNNEKAVTYYKKKYIFYSVDSWEKIESIDADEIKNYGSYTFENCEDYIFVFDDNRDELINRIPIDF